MVAFMSMNAGAETQSHAASMDRIYRSQRHIYDATRAYYLLGRDGLVRALALRPGQTCLEIGCGTGRNLVSAAKRYPGARLFGIDISQEMLRSASASLKRAGIAQNVQLAAADATAFDASVLFGVAQFDRVYFSYTLSMIPDWQAALQQAVSVVKPGGSIHIVDFGGCERLPGGFKTALYRWLSKFHVTPRLALESELQSMLADTGGRLQFEHLFRGYAIRATLTSLA